MGPPPGGVDRDGTHADGIEVLLETAAAVEADEVVLPRGVVASEDRARPVAEDARPVVAIQGP